MIGIKIICFLFRSLVSEIIEFLFVVIVLILLWEYNGVFISVVSGIIILCLFVRLDIKFKFW